MTDLLADTATRLVFANELVPGSVIVQPCEGYYINGGLKCDVETTVHGDRHVLTVQRIRNGLGACAIVLTEDGIESPWQMGGNGVVRVTAESPVGPQSDEPHRRKADDGSPSPVSALPWWKKVLGYGASVVLALAPFALGAAVVLVFVWANHAGSR